MTLIVGLLIIGAALAFVAVPFFRPDSAADAGNVGPRRAGERQKLERQKLEAYAAIKEAEFDYRMGKLSDGDLAAMREKFSAQALEAIAALEATRTASARHRANGRPAARVAFCASCGHAVPPRANFCPGCGWSVREAVA